MCPLTGAFSGVLDPALWAHEPPRFPRRWGIDIEGLPAVHTSPGVWATCSDSRRGSRIGELRQVRWDQVDFTANEIKLAKRQTKEKAARTLPIYSDMREWLLIQKTECDQHWPECPLVFHYLDRPIGSHIKGWGKVCKEAGLPRLRFHDLRRSAVRNMERAGILRKILWPFLGT